METAEELVLPLRSSSDAASSVFAIDDIKLHAFEVYIQQQNEHIKYLQDLLVEAGYAPPSNAEVNNAPETQEILHSLVQSGRTGGVAPVAPVVSQKADVHSEPVEPKREIVRRESSKSSSSSSSSSSEKCKETPVSEPTPTPVAAPSDLRQEGSKALQSHPPSPVDGPLNNTLVSYASHRSAASKSADPVSHVSHVSQSTKATPAEVPLPVQHLSHVSRGTDSEPVEKPSPLKPKHKTNKPQAESEAATPRAFKTPRKPLKNHESPAALEPAPAFDLPSTVVNNKVKPNALSTPPFPMTPQTPLPPAAQEVAVGTSASQPMPPPFARQIESGSPVPQCWCYLKAPPAMPGAPPLYKKRLLKVEGEMLTFSSMTGGKLVSLEAVLMNDIKTFGNYSDASQVMSLGVSFYLCTHSKAWIGIACDGDVLSGWLSWLSVHEGISTAPVGAPLPIEPNLLAISPQRYTRQ